MVKLFTCANCLIGIVFYARIANAIPGWSSDSGSGSGSGSEDDDSDGDTDYDYDEITMPSAVGKSGILDSAYYDCSCKSLYFVDLFGNKIFRYSEEDDSVYYATVSGLEAGPSFCVPIRKKPGHFLVGAGHSVYKVEWDGKSTKATSTGTLATVEENTDHSMNHGMAGPNGEFYFGTLGSTLCGSSANQGFYRWSKNGGLQRLPGSYKTTNSLGFDKKRGLLYHLDGCKQSLIRWKVSSSGKLSRRQVVLSTFGLPKSAAPVGIGITKKGNLRISSYKNGTLFFVNPTRGKIYKTLQLPTRFGSAVAFGACDSGYNRLYVLTGQTDFNILTGSPTNITVPSPGGSLIVLTDVGKGTKVSKPCIGC